MTDNGPLLRLENVYKRYSLPGSRTLRAVNGVDLEIRAGECLSIVGESGSGKSTLVRMAARVEPVTEGRILFSGEPVEHLQGAGLRGLRRKIQVIFQDPISVFSPRMKIGEFLREPLVNYGIVSRKEAGKAAVYLLETVGLDSGYIGRYPHELSGGELQRVAIVRAMAVDPLLLICDEPTSALDVTIQERVIELLNKLRRDSGAAMMFISHDLALVSGFSDRIAVMFLGYLVESFPGASLGQGAKHPYTQALLRSVFTIGQDRGDEIEVLRGETPSPTEPIAGCPFASRCPYSGELCEKEKPPLREVGPGHYAACFFIGG